jgi:hypothetical protein
MGKKTCSSKKKSWIDSNFLFPLFLILEKFHHLHKAMGVIIPHHGTFNTTNQEQQCDELTTTLTIEGSMAMVRTW